MPEHVAILQPINTWGNSATTGDKCAKRCSKPDVQTNTFPRDNIPQPVLHVPNDKCSFICFSRLHSAASFGAMHTPPQVQTVFLLLPLALLASYLCSKTSCRLGASPDITRWTPKALSPKAPRVSGSPSSSTQCKTSATHLVLVQDVQLAPARAPFLKEIGVVKDDQELLSNNEHPLKGLCHWKRCSYN